MKWPWISRKRYEREIEQLHYAYSISTTDLRKQLISIIEKFSMIVLDHKGLGIEVVAKIKFPETGFYDRHFSPADKEEIFWHIAKRLSEELKMQARAISLRNGLNK